MYYNPRRRGGIGVAGTRARQAPVESHQGTPADYLRRHERDATAAVHGDAATRTSFFATLLKRTADTRNLRMAWDYLTRHGGQAPGPDGLHYDDLDDREVWKLLRVLGGAILADTYCPGPDRKVPIPKSSGHGTRTLLLSSVIDRVVQRAVVQTIQPYLDPQFDEYSFGYRPGRDRQHALAQAEYLTISSNTWVWLTEDIRDAFNQVPQHRLLDVVRFRFTDEGIVRLIQRIVLTETGRGLRQGGCLSPLLLNLYLDHHLDRRWRKHHPNLPLIRVADDLLVLTCNKEEGFQTWTELKETLLPAGMPLKGSPSLAIRDLSSGEHATWLGFDITSGRDGLEMRLTDKTWNSLRQQLELTHTETNSPLKANEVLSGWIDQLGPCYSWCDRQAVYARLESIAQELAYDENPTREALEYRWKGAYGRWHTIRRMEA